MTSTITAALRSRAAAANPLVPTHGEVAVLLILVVLIALLVVAAVSLSRDEHYSQTHQRRTLLGLGLLSCALSIVHGFATAPGSSGNALSTGELIAAALGAGFLVILYAIVLVPLALGRAWAPTLGAVFAGIAVAGALTDLAGLNGTLTPPALVLTLCLIGVNITWIRLEREDSGWVGLGTCLLTMLLFGVELVVLLVQSEPTPGELLPRMLIIAGAFAVAVAIRRHWKRSAGHDQLATSTGPSGVER